MQKILLALSLIFVVNLTVKAQNISDHAIGVRIAGGNGTGGEISYQKHLDNNNRLEVDLGIASEINDFKLTGTYQWLWSIEKQFNWYAGVGGGVVSASNFGIYGAGVIGLEYNFEAPIVASLDYRPELGFSGAFGFISNIGIAVRYQF